MRLTGAVQVEKLDVLPLGASQAHGAGKEKSCIRTGVDVCDVSKVVERRLRGRSHRAAVYSQQPETKKSAGALSKVPSTKDGGGPVFRDGLFDEYAYDVSTCRKSGDGKIVSAYFDGVNRGIDLERAYEK